MLAAGASLLVAASFASAAESAKGSSDIRRGGTLRVNIPGGDIDHIDPSLAYGTTTWEIQYATALKLLDYPDAPAPRGSRLVPSGASRFSVSNGGRRYTFTIRPGFRFSNGERVTAANYAYAINRSLGKELQSPGFQFVADPAGSNIVGAEAVRQGARRTAAGVVVRGNRLIINLTKSDPTFLAKISMPFFQAMSRRLPEDREVISVNDRNDLPSAGPYFVSFREPNRSIVVTRNPFYRGPRPRNLQAINFRVGVNLEAGFNEVRAGQADYQLGLPPTAHAELGRQFGVNRSRYRVQPSNCVAYYAFNHDRPLMRGNVRLKRAINYVISRQAIVQQYGAYAGRPHDQILPPGFPGFINANIYPLTRPNVTRARQLAQGALRGGRAVFFHGLTAPGPQVMEIVRADLRRIGLEIEPRGFRGFAIYDAAGKRGSAHDITTVGWCQDYPDPYDFINVLLYGGNIQAENNNNLAYFNNPAYNRKMARAARMLGEARLRTYGALDVDIMRNQAPWAVWLNPTDLYFFGARIVPRSFIINPIYENVSFGAIRLR